MDREADAWQDQAREWLLGAETDETEDGLELTLVELVVAASECSEDETEVSDLVDELIRNGRVQVRDAACQEPGLALSPAPGDAR